MDSDQSSEDDHSEPEMNDSLVSEAAPVAGYSDVEGGLGGVDNPQAANNCPIQRLQDRFRPHNSTDPRPRPPAPPAIDRDSVASASSSGSRFSSRVNSRFSFGLLLQPSLDLFKFKDIRTSTGSPRGSGWSLWFRQDDGPKAKPSVLSSSQ